MKFIDAHIHLDQYEEIEIEQMIHDLDRIHCTHLVTVSSCLQSCKKNLELATRFEQVKPAFGYHPEQQLPTDREVSELFQWIEQHQEQMVAIGEIGLPYYTRREKNIPLGGYVELLEQFFQKAKEWDKPVVLHAVYEDAPIVCDYLEKYNVAKAHFHWFKGDEKTTERMIQNGYYISNTPDVLYESEIQSLVSRYPLQQMMVETDGPWPFEGIFSGKKTHPNMIHKSIETIALIKRLSVDEVYDQVYENTLAFYGLL